MTEKSLRDVVLNFVIARRDTTATTLTWAIYMIMTHDHVAEKLHLDLKVLKKNGQKKRVCHYNLMRQMTMHLSVRD